MKTTLALALLPLAVLATPPTPLDPVVVTATRTAQNLSQTLASTLVISRDEIDRAHAADLADLLRFIAGFEVDRAGGPGQLAQVRVRGGETDHVLLLIDGVRVNPATSGPALQALAPETIERIEIVKGPRSTLYGSEGISATIHVITRGFAARTSAHGGAGSHGARAAGAGLARHEDGAGYSLQVDHARSDGIPTCTDATLDRGHRRTSLAARGELRAGPVTFRGSALHNRGRVDYLNFGCPGGSIPATQDFTSEALAVELAASPTPRWTTTLQLSRTLDDVQQEEADDYSRTTRPRLDWSHVLALGDAHRLSGGIEIEHERGEALFTGFGRTLVQEGRDIGALRLQHELAGGRHHGLVAARAVHDSAFGDHVVWNAEYGLDVARATRLIATAGSGYRAPTFLERSPGFFGNPDLEPEASRSFELGLRHAFAPGHWLDVRAFRTDTRDLITGFPPQNIARARSEGVDLGYRGLAGAWSWLLTGIVQDPEDRATGGQLPRRARRSAALKLDRSIGRHQLGLEVLATGRRTDTDFSGFPGVPVELGGYTLVNLHATAQLDDHLRLQLSAGNVLDADYETAFGYRQPGASLHVGLRLDY